MKRTTIMLPPDLKTRVLRLANQMGISLGEFVRESLEAMVKRPHDQDKRDQLFSDDAVFRGKAPKDSAKDHDRYLYGDKQ